MSRPPHSRRTTHPGPPPTSHTLKPHHLQVLKLISLVFHHYANAKLPAIFQLHIYRTLLEEVSEVREPANYHQLITAVVDNSKAVSQDTRDIYEDFRNAHLSVVTPDDIGGFFSSVPYLVPGAEDDDTSPFTGRSIFGYFVRRCHVSYRKLSFDAINQLFKDYHAWVAGTLNEQDQSVTKDLLDNSYNMYKTLSDKRQFAQPDLYGDFQKEQDTGDQNTATERLRGFFEQHFHEGNESGLRHVALLNVARMHWVQQEYTACRRLLQEAVNSARSCNDPVTLQACIGLMNRLPPLEQGRKPIINELQAYLHPLEILNDVKKLMQVSHQQPLSATFEKITEALAAHDYWTDKHMFYPVESEQWAQHAVQSVAWSMAGCTRLANIEETIVIAFSHRGCSDNSRITMIANRAYRLARQGHYQPAISMLLHPDVFSGLSISDYNLWAMEIWQILTLRASRRGQMRAFKEFLNHNRPKGNYVGRNYWFDARPMGSVIRDPLFHVIQWRKLGQSHRCVEALLKGLWEAEFLQRYGLYRVALVMLADLGLEYGMTKWCRRLVEEILPQVISGDEIELRAYTCFTYARCIIAAGDAKPEALQEALKYLLFSESDYNILEMYSSLKDVYFLQSVIYHNLNMDAEREEAAKKCLATEEKCQALESVVDEWIVEVWDLVSRVGAKLASR